MELTTEEKARVFAMYQGQKVLCYPSDDFSHWLPPTKLGWSVIAGTHYCVDNTILSLTLLDKITDEHAIEVAKYFMPSGYGNISAVSGMNWIYFFLPNLSYQIHQYLISKGYDVPLWFGIDHWANGKTAIELGIAVTN